MHLRWEGSQGFCWSVSQVQPGRGSNQQVQVCIGPKKIRPKLVTGFSDWKYFDHISKGSFHAVMGVKASQD